MKKLFYLVALLCLAFSCKSIPEGAVAFDDVKYVTEFKDKTVMPEGKLVNLGIAAPGSLVIQDSILIVSTRNVTGMLTFFNINNNFENLGNYLALGRAANEFLEFPRISDNKVYSDGENIYILLLSSTTGKAMKVNVTQTIA
ncbi:MAG: hypothetical protein R3Y26_01240 [Rikenellaceae bacterium]